MSATSNNIRLKQFIIHLPKLLLILGCLGYEIYLFIAYSSYYLKYTYILVDLAVGAALSLVLLFLLLRLIKKYLIYKRQKDSAQTKRILSLLIYYVIMGYFVFIPTFVFSFSVSGFIGLIFSFPALCLILIEIFFLLVLRGQKSLERWEQRFDKRKAVMGGILVIFLLLPLCLNFTVSHIPSFSQTPEISLKTHYDTAVLPNYTQQYQQQVLDNASSFSLNSYLINGSINDYMTLMIEDNQLTYDIPPSFIQAAVRHLFYNASITVYQANYILNYTEINTYHSRISNSEEQALTWEIYSDFQSLWINPLINSSFEDNSSVSLSGPIFLCEFMVEDSSRFGMWSGICYIFEKTLLDSNGQVLIITREDHCTAYA